MKIVIEKESIITVFAVSLYAITGGDYEDIKETVTELVEKMSYTPLPRRHGRLGDLDALEKEMVNGIKAGNFEEGYETFTNINNVDDCVKCVKYADAIIEADKEGEQE